MWTRRGMLVAALAGRRRVPEFYFRTRGATGFMDTDGRLASLDGGKLRIHAVGPPNHSGWLPYCFFKDGRAVLFSIEFPPDWRTRAFQDYYPKSPTHMWIYNPANGRLDEICTRDRLSNFQAPCLLMPGEKRIAFTVVAGNTQRLATADLDGGNPEYVTQPGEYVYGVSLSPDGSQFAYHSNYRITTCDVRGGARRDLVGERGIICFGTSWSPDGKWVLFQRCDPKNDPGHDWSDVQIARADGSEIRSLTTGAQAWFAASYGSTDNPGGGSNAPRWSPDGKRIQFPRRSDGASTPWQFQASRPDTTHHNRDFKPELARGGVHLAVVDPESGRTSPLTKSEDGQWDFRASWSPDGRRVLFLRAQSGGNPELWIMNADGSGERRLSNGVAARGVEHPIWSR